MALPTKECKGCHQVKPIDDFYCRLRQNGGTYYSGKCKVCLRKQQQCHKDPASNLLYNYSLSEVGYQLILKAQNGVCAICKQKCKTGHRLCVDEDHNNSNKIRGLLCRQCNRALGLFGDSVELLEAAILHLKKVR